MQLLHRDGKPAGKLYTAVLWQGVACVLGAPRGDLGGTSSTHLVTGGVGVKTLERLHGGILLQKQKPNP